MTNCNLNLPEANGTSCEESKSNVDGQSIAGEAMEEDGLLLPDPRDRKRLKRGALPSLPSLPSEQGFVSGVLDSCPNLDQRRFALAYRRWLRTVIHQQL